MKMGLSAPGSAAGRRWPGAGVRNDRKSLSNASSKFGCRHAASIFSFHALPDAYVLIL